MTNATTTTAPMDSRPRAYYKLPGGKKVAVILDHGERPRRVVSFQIADGEIVQAEFIALSVAGL